MPISRVTIHSLTVLCLAASAFAQSPAERLQTTLHRVSNLELKPGILLGPWLDHVLHDMRRRQKEMRVIVVQDDRACRVDPVLLRLARRPADCHRGAVAERES